ncbi:MULTISPECIES: bifunctional alpha/beta hydrolase/OsmC family protein [unclassified Colwellia]|uniref:bifunctional alpha/beta hydrolase/OsmC family protein n=1 Tax=unclassified Colwellia TaxID=196834 RepID=UPI0015F5FD23|nr:MULTISPECIES: bifunctional alpha/beta hydrolase/OsmC family protein [unclassified Colwellia]MBA6379510.1 bifunctional alpha/beta hydrolase/OsmC family protein [Colwellia sp. BRX10-7]MBA6385769.1 bifunctional alpha/beta hydrolase/OsmC family protein [Colwellia sp. BRX10-2]MBA6400709.1 bifunctional alpha/beta hydrolase/OsmC family protein [Colwellia sp. BRX10-5]MBA6405319.1 bifunctional alpha/beta hydrolase/OsmC family protein [Colwellia sp. BRX10-1]
MRKKVEFPSQGQYLAGLLETPDQKTRAYVLFAHCFTCGKDIAAASRISRFLVQHGFAVFRFDFTGLGNSDGDFANTNFSSNTEDLLSAAHFLEKNYQAPQLLIGHSLGGAAVLAMASQLPKVKAVVTIGAPYEVSHVIHNFDAHLDKIEQSGSAKVSLGSREFTIKKQFLDDLRNQTTEHIQHLNKALLVLHSPIDLTVDISDAEKIYKAAKHPKSFVSLDTADHLLSKSIDSEYVAQTISGWASRYLPAPEISTVNITKGHVLVAELDHKFQQEVFSDSHHWYADEPTQSGGKNSGPDPYEHLLAALGTCTAMTIRMYADHKKIPLQHVEVSLSHERNYLNDADKASEHDEKIESLLRKVQLFGPLSDNEKKRLMEIADRCPVHRTLHNNPQILTVLIDG